MLVMSMEACPNQARMVFISGAGIAGPTSAYWLAHSASPQPSSKLLFECGSEVYLIDFWGAEFDIVERMGISPEIRRKGLPAKRGESRRWQW
jgi:2-polyprenyl-6-methoxyphenol hydroxylase-like FAD-dependent oxidoreductase